MTNNLAQAFRDMRNKHGSHFQAAKSLGIAPDHYRKMRNGRVNIPPRTADYIILKASELEGGPPAAPPQQEAQP